jgi:hypothetical protein
MYPILQSINSYPALLEVLPDSPGAWFVSANGSKGSLLNQQQ